MAIILISILVSILFNCDPQFPSSLIIINKKKKRCKDSQTSADANEAGQNTGAMSHAIVKV